MTFQKHFKWSILSEIEVIQYITTYCDSFALISRMVVKICNQLEQNLISFFKFEQHTFFCTINNDSFKALQVTKILSKAEGIWNSSNYLEPLPPSLFPMLCRCIQWALHKDFKNNEQSPLVQQTGEAEDNCRICHCTFQDLLLTLTVPRLSFVKRNIANMLH